MVKSKKVCLFCEKPSQARHWAEALGGKENAMSGTYKGQPYVIAASRGFLFELAQPDQMVASGLVERVQDWDPALLPWDETWFDWRYVPRKNEKGSASDAKATAQAMARAAAGCDEICVAGDLDPQGTGFEIEALNIIEQGLDRPGVTITRAEFGDESAKELQRGFEARYVVPDIRRNKEWLRSVTRERFDMLSMQWTRVLTRANPTGAVLRTGRLKGAMVRLVGDQEDAIAAYVKKTVYQASFVDENGVRYVDDAQPMFERRGDVPLGGLHESDVVIDSKTAKRTAPPRLMDLATLSGRLAGQMSSKTILSLYQSLYDAQFVSYPRTEDTKVTPEQKAELMPLVPQIARVVGVDPSILTHTADRKTHVGSGMAHGANRPGPKVPASLDTLDAQFGHGAGAIYETLARSFLAMLAEDATYDAYKAHVKDFPSYKGTASVPTSAGWRVVFDDQAETAADASQRGPGTRAKPDVREITNKRPPSPTSKWLFAQLSKYDVGTGATRTSTLAEVCAGMRPLMDERRGKLSLTDGGRSEHTLISGTHIADLDLTARLYRQMQDVADGKGTMAAVLAQVKGLVRDDMTTIEANSRAAGLWRDDNPLERVTVTWKGEQRSFKRVWSGHRFTDDEVTRLMAGETIEFQATSQRTGRTFDAKGKLGEHTWKGRKLFGFVLETDGRPSGGNGRSQGSRAGSTARRRSVGVGKLPTAYRKHRFTKEERDALAAGRCIAVDDLPGIGIAWTKERGIQEYR